MDKTLPAEALLAVTGIARLLDDKPKAITRADATRAIKLPAELADWFRSYLSDSALAKPASENITFDYNETAKELIEAEHDIEARQSAAMDKATDIDLARDYATVSREAIGYLRSKIEPRLIPSFLGDVAVNPGRHETYCARRIYLAVDDPMGTVIGDLRRGCLVSDQVQTFKDVYPELYGVTVDTLVDALAERKAKSNAWTVPWLKRAQLETLMQISRLSPELAAELQQRAGAATTRANTPHRPLDIDAKADFATPGTRLGQ